MKTTLLILMTLSLLVSCAETKSPVNVKVSSSAFSSVGGVFDGGAVLLGVGGKSGLPKLTYSVPLNNTEYEQDFAHGVWKFMVLGWHGGGTDMMSGDLYCGIVHNVEIPTTNPDINISMTKVDTNGDLVVETDHPCKSYFSNLADVRFTKFCELSDCTSPQKLYHSTDLSIRFGIPHFEGISNPSNIKNYAKFGTQLSECLVPANNGGLAKVSYSSPLIVPQKMIAGGFSLPLMYEVFEDDTTNTTNCTEGLNGKLSIANSFDERHGDNSNVHYPSFGSNNFIFRLPPPAFELMGVSNNETIDNNLNEHIFNLNAPGNSDLYQSNSVTYTCEMDLTTTPVDTWTTCPTTQAPVQGGKLTFAPSTGEITLEADPVNRFDYTQGIKFRIKGSYNDGAVHESPEKVFMVNFNPATMYATLPYAISNSVSLTFMSIDTTMTDLPLIINNFAFTNDSGPAPTLVSNTSFMCNPNDPCDILIDTSLNTSGDFGSINFQVDGAIEIHSYSLP